MAIGIAGEPTGRDSHRRAVADLDIMLEQPCATLTQCAAVRDACGLAMKLDESAHDTQFAGWWDGVHGCCGVKLSKFGGYRRHGRLRICVCIWVRKCV